MYTFVTFCHLTFSLQTGGESLHLSHRVKRFDPNALASLFFFSIYKLLYDGLKDKDIYNDINNNHYQNMYMTGKGISRRRERRIRNINLGLSQHLFPFLTLALRNPFPPPGPSKIAKSSSMALETKNQSHISDLNLLLLITTPGTSHSSTLLFISNVTHTGATFSDYKYWR